jgi:hypothetical protein
MNKPLILAALAAFVLVGASYPEDSTKKDDTAAPPTSWRPCRTRTDDHCIQLYEHGVRAAYAQWLREHGIAPARLASASPRHHARHHRHAVQIASRCIESPRARAPREAARVPRPQAGASVSGM